MKKNILQRTCLLIFGIMCSLSSSAQINPLGTSLYFNPYLANPAFAGLEKGWEVGASYKSQWLSIEGSPNMQALTATYGSADNRVGVGINLYHETASIIRNINIKGSYAYHLPLNQSESYFDFGLAIGLTNDRLDFNQTKGDLDDQSLGNFNNRKSYIDGDFGTAYRSRHLTLQAIVPNLRSLFRKSSADRLADKYLFTLSAGYKIITDSQWGLDNFEPRIAMRAIQQNKNIWDMGLNFNFSEGRFNFSTIYHSSQSLTVGAGTIYKNRLSLIFQYTTNTAPMQGYVNGEVELGIKYRL